MVTVNPEVPTIEGMNVAYANYLLNPFDPTLYCLSATFFVEVDYGKNNFGNINFVDHTCYSQGAVNIKPVRAMVKPDVAIGNSNTLSSMDFTFAVAYEHGCNAVYIDYYQISYSAWGVFTVSPTPVATTIINDAYNPHIDIITDESITVNGLAYCNDFVVTWNDCSGNIYTEKASVSSPPAVMNSTSATLVATNGVMPDVAAVQRNISGSVHNVALVAYINRSSHNELNFVEHDFNTGITTTPIVLDAGTWNSTQISKPRIDAFDLASFSTSPTWSTRSQYKVVAELDSGGSKIVRAYDNLLYGLTSFFSSASVVDVSTLPGYSAYTSGYNHYTPCVAANVRNPFFGNDDFFVSHYTRLNNITNDALLFMEPYDCFAPADIEVVPGFTPSQNYYLVNTNYPASMGEAEGPNAVATSCNLFIFANSFVHVWATNSPAYNIFYKIVGVNGSSTYNYRVSSVQANTKASVADIHTYPNPATDVVNIDMNETNKRADCWEMYDMLGHKVLSGNIDNNKVLKVDTHLLVPGAYIVKLFGKGKLLENTKFIKR